MVAKYFAEIYLLMPLLHSGGNTGTILILTDHALFLLLLAFSFHKITFQKAVHKWLNALIKCNVDKAAAYGRQICKIFAK